MGPYSLGFAYLGPRFDEGEPLEETWIGRAGSENFKELVNYRDDYQPGAVRYDVGERSNFALTPMAVAALEQVLDWQPVRIQDTARRSLAISWPASGGSAIRWRIRAIGEPTCSGCGLPPARISAWSANGCGNGRSRVAARQRHSRRAARLQRPARRGRVGGRAGRLNRPTLALLGAGVGLIGRPSPFRDA